MTATGEERLRELASRAWGGEATADEREALDAAILEGGRAAEVVAEVARDASVLEAYFDEAGREVEVRAVFEEAELAAARAGGAGRGLWWAAAAAVVVLLGMHAAERGERPAGGGAVAGAPVIGTPVHGGEGGGRTEVPEAVPAVAQGQGQGTGDVLDAGEIASRLERFFLPEVEVEGLPLREALAVLAEGLRLYGGDAHGDGQLARLVLGAGDTAGERRVTLRARGVPLMVALRSFAAQAGAELVLEPPAVALVATDGGPPEDETGMLTKLYAAEGIGPADGMAQRLRDWGVDLGEEGEAVATPDGGLLVRTSVRGQAAAGVMMGELARREREPLVLEIIRVVVDEAAAAQLEATGAFEVGEAGGVAAALAEAGIATESLSTTAVSVGDQQPVVVAGDGSVPEPGTDGGAVASGDSGGGEPAEGGEVPGDPLVTLAGGGAMTLVPMRAGEGFALGVEGGALSMDLGAPGAFMSSGTRLVVGLGDDLLDAGDLRYFVVGVSEDEVVPQDSVDAIEP